MKAQIDWIPLALSAVRSTRHKTLAVMQASDRSQSIHAVNPLRWPGRWMRLITVPDQTSIDKAGPCPGPAKTRGHCVAGG